MAILLLDTCNDRHHTGQALVDAVLATGIVAFDYSSRKVAVRGRLDTVSFSSEYQGDELIREMARRALRLLTRDHGFVLYRAE